RRRVLRPRRQRRSRHRDPHRGHLRWPGHGPGRRRDRGGLRPGHRVSGEPQQGGRGRAGRPDRRRPPPGRAQVSRLADRLTRSRLVLSVRALAALLAGSGSPAWARAHVTTVLGPEPVSVSGTTAAPALAATALVAGAAGLAVALGRRVGALLGGLALLGSAVAVVAVVSGFLSDPATPVRRAAGEISGVPELTGAVDVTSWPYLTFVLAAALALAGVGIIALSGRWSATGR